MTNIAVNRSAYVVIDPIKGEKVIGNKTEGALLTLARMWNYDCDAKKKESFDDIKDKFFAFNSSKKRSTAVIHRTDGSVTLFCKGAAEEILNACKSMLTPIGEVIPMTPENMRGLSLTIYQYVVVITHNHYHAYMSKSQIYMIFLSKWAAKRFEHSVWRILISSRLTSFHKTGTIILQTTPICVAIASLASLTLCERTFKTQFALLKQLELPFAW